MTTAPAPTPVALLLLGKQSLAESERGTICPGDLPAASDPSLVERARAAKAKLGDRLFVLGHHYQRDEVIQFADVTGDSFKLAEEAAARPEAEFIVFCGVHFMAESADILTAEHQRVILPDLAAGCSMADMAALDQVEDCWDALTEAGIADQVVPLTYMNSSADIKAFTGREGGAVCTSSNARRAMEWALGRVSRMGAVASGSLGRGSPGGGGVDSSAIGDDDNAARRGPGPAQRAIRSGRHGLEQKSKILFLPDQHLGRNTAVRELGLSLDDCVLWNPRRENGGLTAEQLRDATVILWQGHCSVHGRFTYECVTEVRERIPGVTVLVHPECRYEVAQAADLVGSTEFIIRTVREAPSGTAFAIGTELNLVNRLAHDFPDKPVTYLDKTVCFCSTMNRIDLPHLVWALESLVDGNVVNEIVVDHETRKYARLALDRMLSLTDGPVTGD